MGNAAAEQIGEKDVAYALAENVANVNYEDIPANVVAATKDCILDTLGTIIAGSGVGVGIAEVVELVKEQGGREESSVVGYGLKVPSMMAAFANGAMAHCLDYDNVHDEAGGHPTITTLPAALAIAERVGRVSGKQLIAAITLGDDLACRVLYSTTRPKGHNLKWNRPLTLGVFNASAVSAKLLGLDTNRIVDAFGIALHQAGGPFEVVLGVGSMTRGMYAGFAGMTGVLSALMARRGITSIKTCFEGKAGLFNVYFNGDYDRPSLTEGLGKVFEGTGVSFKPWPSCRWSHPYVDATLQIVRQYDIRPHEVQEVTVHVGNRAKSLCEPLDLRRKPVTPLDAKFSLPFTIGTAIAKRNIVIEDFAPEGLNNSVSLQLAQKVVAKYDPGIDGISVTPPAKVDIMTTQGKLYSKRVELPYGNPKNPICKDDLVNKFRDCASHSAKPIPRENVERVIGIVAKLEDLDDVSQIMRLIA